MLLRGSSSGEIHLHRLCGYRRRFASEGNDDGHRPVMTNCARRLL